MGLQGIKREGTPGFQKVVFENVIDTLPGGLVLDIDPANYPDGFVPEGTLVGRDPATGLGVVLTTTGGAIKPVGLTYRNTIAEVNALAGVVIDGTARIKALPATEQGIADDIATSPYMKIAIV